MYKSDEIQVQKELSPINRFLPWTEHRFMDGLSQKAMREPQGLISPAVQGPQTPVLS